MTNEPVLATKTLAAIDAAMKADQGASFRGWLGKVVPHISDAFNDKKESNRGHLGASLIGRECERQLWYGFRWATASSYDGRMLRLFNRGHLEEARFIAMLLMIGCQVYQQDEHGRQFRISDADGHFGGSCDGVCVGCPDLPEGKACLTEFKTHNDNSFKKLKMKGVIEAKPEHYIQMCIYMQKMGLDTALYMAVNKNDDELYAELVTLNPQLAEEYLARGRKIIYLKQAPARISDSPGFYLCRMCPHLDVCQMREDPDLNCRTCRFGVPITEGRWVCRESGEILDRDMQRNGCIDYCPNVEF